MKKIDYDEKKIREMRWYLKKPAGMRNISSRILHHPIFYSYKRTYFNYIFPKQQMAEVVKRHLDRKVDRLLLAPCGTGDDLKYLGNFAKDIYGIDLSPLAVEQCPNGMKIKTGDILHSGYQDEQFDLIASPLFFHHLADIGFEPFLKEFHRLLKKGGGLVILEPSVFHPLNIITRPMKYLLKNPYDEVEDEEPIDPRMMASALRRAGFVNIEMRAASYSHCSFYVPAAKIVNQLTKPLLNAPLIKYLGWMTVYWAEKQ